MDGIQALKPSYATGYARSASEAKHPHLWKGLVGAWAPTLGNTGQSTMPDLSRHTNTATRSGLLGGSDWDVEKGYVTYNFGALSTSTWDTPDGELLYTTVTFSAWIIPTALDEIFLRDLTGVNGWIPVWLATNWLVRVGVTGTTFDTGVAASTYLNKLVHVTVSVTPNGTLYFYLDGQQKYTSAVGALVTPTSYWRIGRNGTNVNCYHGSWLEVDIYDRQLSAGEIRQLYQLGPGGLFQKEKRVSVYSASQVEPVTGGPFPHYIRRLHHGGFITMGRV